MNIIPVYAVATAIVVATAFWSKRNDLKEYAGTIIVSWLAYNTVAEVIDKNSVYFVSALVDLCLMSYCAHALWYRRSRTGLAVCFCYLLMLVIDFWGALSLHKSYPLVMNCLYVAQLCSLFIGGASVVVQRHIHRALPANGNTSVQVDL